MRMLKLQLKVSCKGVSSWFRDYVYIPLGGSKKGEGRTYLNLLVVWLFTGLWHGSTLNFLLWGLFLFALISLECLGWGSIWMAFLGQPSAQAAQPVH